MMSDVICVTGADGGAKRGGGVAIVPVSSSKRGGTVVVGDSGDFNDDDDDAMLSMCTDNEGDALLTSAFTDDTLMDMDVDQLSA